MMNIKETFLYRMNVEFNWDGFLTSQEVFVEAYDEEQAVGIVEEDLIMNDYTSNEFKISDVRKCDVFYSFHSPAYMLGWK